MKKNFLLFIFLLFIAPFGISQDSLTTSLLWEISGKKVKSPAYIFGTMHLIPNEDFLFPETLQQKVKESEVLVMEIGGVAEQMKIMHMMTLDTGSVFDYFTPPQLDSLFEYTEKELGYDEAKMRLVFSKMKPFILMQLFTKETFGENPQSYEMSLEKIAKTEELEIIGLETVEEQVSFFDKLSMSDQVNMIMKALRSEEDGELETRKLIDIYLSQNVDEIYNYTVEAGMSSPTFEEDFLNKRNKDWIAPIQKIIRKNKAFIAVGAAHLGGPQGIIKLLKTEGYTLTPVKL